MSYIEDKEPRFRFDNVLLLILLVTLAVLAIAATYDSSLDKGRCLKSRHIEAYSYYLSKPPMWQTIPAHDVCDEWEFPRGRPTK
jgi:hypothetical protein